MWVQAPTADCVMPFEASRRLVLDREVDREHLARDLASADRVVRRHEAAASRAADRPFRPAKGSASETRCLRTVRSARTAGSWPTSMNAVRAHGRDARRCRGLRSNRTMSWRSGATEPRGPAIRRGRRQLLVANRGAYESRRDGPALVGPTEDASAHGHDQGKFAMDSISARLAILNPPARSSLVLMESSKTCSTH